MSHRYCKASSFRESELNSTLKLAVFVKPQEMVSFLASRLPLLIKELSCERHPERVLLCTNVHVNGQKQQYPAVFFRFTKNTKDIKIKWLKTFEGLIQLDGNWPKNKGHSFISFCRDSLGLDIEQPSQTQADDLARSFDGRPSRDVEDILKQLLVPQTPQNQVFMNFAPQSTQVLRELSQNQAAKPPQTQVKQVIKPMSVNRPSDDDDIRESELVTLINFFVCFCGNS